ncbi:MAG: NIPSNAP family protein [Verrucomicrobiota bacterium]
MKYNIIKRCLDFAAVVVAFFLPATALSEQVVVELRTYTCGTEAKRDTLMGLFDRALIPALNRQQIRAGVYASSAELNQGEQKYDTMLYTLLVHESFDSFLNAENKLLADQEYMQSSREVFEAPMDDPLYTECRSSLLYTFKTCPEVVKVAQSPDRIIQLRIYNSYTIERNAKKIEMFEGGGEIELFRNSGMPPIFFGHGLAGDQLANLTYMLSFDTMDQKKQAWKTFVDSAGWKKLKADPQYKDTANKITNVLMRPSKNSQF